MGLFSTKKTIVVSSTVYNMAGPVEDRPNFLKSSVFSAVMSPNQPDIGETVVINHMTGPGMNQRRFFNWAVRNDFKGLPTISMSQIQKVEPADVAPHIPTPADPPGLQLQVDNAYLAPGDFSVFAEQYMKQNHPSLVLSNWTSDYDKGTHQITIQFEDGSTEVFDAGEFDPGKSFVVAEYYHYEGESEEPVVQGTRTVDTSYPDTAGFTQDSSANDAVQNFTLNYSKTVTKSYSDGRPDEVTTTNHSDPASFQSLKAVWSKVEYEGNDGSSVETKKVRTLLNIWDMRKVGYGTSTTQTQDEPEPGVTRTTTTETSGDTLVQQWDTRTDTQDLIQQKIIGGNQIFIYRIGGANTQLNALKNDVDTGVVTPEYFPFIPVRLNNVSINAPTHVDSGLRDSCEVAYRKATGNKENFQSLVDQVEANESLDEIDYAYVQYGVCLNEQDASCKRYLYEFFRKLIPFQNTTSTYFTDYKSTAAEYEAAINEYKSWLVGQNQKSHPLWNAPKPAFPTLEAPKTTTIRLQTDNPATDDSDMRISWISIDEQLFAGKGKTGAKKGEVWLEKGETFDWNTYSVQSRELRSSGNSAKSIKIYFQSDTDNYKLLTIHGLVHENFIYGGKSVHTSAHEALEDADLSGFIVPLHMPTLKEMGLVPGTQMATANTLIVFNSYKVYKKKWYQTFLGMLVIVVVVVVAAALIAPAAVGGMAGAFGTNAAVGGALGLTGTGAVVAGAVANALAAIVISTAIMGASTAIFGEKWGAIIGSIISFAVSFGMAGGFSNLSTLMSPQNLLSFSSAVANGYNGFVQAEIAEMQADLMDRTSEYNRQMKEIDKMIRELGGGNDLSFNPLQLTDSAAGNGQGGGSYVPETLDEFIQRTTMTGSDIVEVTHSLIANYADMQLTLPES